MALTIIETLVVLLTLAGSFFWLKFTDPTQTYLAAMICLIVIYLIVKRLQIRSKNQSVWFRQNQKPDFSTNMTPELILMGVIIFIIIGFFGGYNSPAFPLVYFYLFFLVFLLPTWSSALVTLEVVMLFYYLTPQFLIANWTTLASLPIFWGLLIFSKTQYFSLVRENSELAAEKEKVAYYNHYAEQQQAASLVNLDKKNAKTWKSLQSFWQIELMPRINELQKLSSSEKNQLIIQAQLTQLNFRLAQLNNILFKNDNSLSNRSKPKVAVQDKKSHRA